MKLSREIWLEVEPLLTTALDLEAAERDGWLARVGAAHPRAAPVLRRLLATHDRAENLRELETLSRLAAPAEARTREPGETLGPFVLVSLLGRGGMGEVWVARHGDGHLAREVALKLPSPHALGDVSRARFRRERDILARLEHPNIARLYDAGVTDEGQPWLAMERVRGAALTEAARALPIAGRLALFRQVLAAVALAHRRLVVHRDLKPANILVDEAGQVKLLDFGIAKLLAGDERDGGELTRVGGRVMTLRYAAPEQVAGEDITTATDVYSLGVILHELLTGLSPYRPVRSGKPLTDMDLMREQPGPPSRLELPRALARALAGDLDAIVLKAMRDDPLERYASIEQFDADIAAYLERRPVSARRGTWRYLAGRFALRHRLPLALGTAIVATLALGLVAAEHERRIAVAEKARAERHLASVRKLANTFIFDIHGKIERLAGSLEAREALVRTSVEYLDALAAEPAADPGLLREIAVGYRNIGNIQGQPGAASTGNVVEAVKSFEKAKRLFVELEDRRPGDITVLREHHMTSFALARALFLLVDTRWEAEIAAAVRLAERAAALPDATPRDLARVPASRAEEAHLRSLMSGQDEALEAVVLEAVAQLEALRALHPGDVGVGENLVGAYERAGSLLSSSRRTASSVRRAIEVTRTGLERAREGAALRPNDTLLREMEVRMIEQLALNLSFTGDHAEADRVMGEAIAILARLAANDGANMGLAAQQSGSLSRAAHFAYQRADHARAIRLAREALAAAARLPAETLRTRDVRSTVAQARFHLGAALCATAGAAGTPPGQRDAAVRESREHMAAVLVFLEAVKAERLGSIAPEEEAWARSIIERCRGAFG